MYYLSRTALWRRLETSSRDSSTNCRRLPQPEQVPSIHRGSCYAMIMNFRKITLLILIFHGLNINGDAYWLKKENKTEVKASKWIWVILQKYDYIFTKLVRVIDLVLWGKIFVHWHPVLSQWWYHLLSNIRERVQHISFHIHLKYLCLKTQDQLKE